MPLVIQRYRKRTSLNAAEPQKGLTMSGLINVDGHSLVSAKAAKDLTGKQWYLAKLNSKGEAELCGEGEAGFVIYEDAAEGDYATLIIGSERAKVTLGGTVAVSETLMSSTEGKAVKTVAESKKLIVAIAREAGASGDIVEVVTIPPAAKA